jgi:hypothetical protein
LAAGPQATKVLGGDAADPASIVSMLSKTAKA